MIIKNDIPGWVLQIWNFFSWYCIQVIPKKLLRPVNERFSDLSTQSFTLTLNLSVSSLVLASSDLWSSWRKIVNSCLLSWLRVPVSSSKSSPSPDCRFGEDVFPVWCGSSSKLISAAAPLLVLVWGMMTKALQIWPSLHLLTPTLLAEEWIISYR